MTCPDCGPDEGILDIHYDLDAVKAAWQKAPLSGRALNHWRYRELLPLDSKAVRNDWSVGWTPVIDVPRLAGELGINQLLLKDEGRNPTASFKDRASSVGVAHALQHHAKTIACASTGNAATSLAGHAALAGLPCVIFVPHTAPEPKLAQLLVFGANVVAVQGSYDEAYRLCSRACEKFGWYNRKNRRAGTGRTIAQLRRRARLGRGQRRGRLHDRRHLEGHQTDARTRRDRPPAPALRCAGGRRRADRDRFEARLHA
jgi:threonine synthase